MNWKTLVIGSWSWKRPFLSIAAIYLLLCIVAVFFADRLIFLPPASSYSKDLPFLQFLRLANGKKIAFVHLKARPSLPTLLYSHGNAEDIGHSMQLFEQWNALGLGVVAYDYPGYGLSPGRPSEKSAQNALKHLWDHLLQSGTPSSSIVIVGRSIGSGPSVWLAEKKQAAGLILISPLKSVYQVAFPLPFPLFPRDRFPSIRRMPRIDTPLLVIHGENDEVIPAHHGKALYQASAASDKNLIIIPETRHNDLFYLAEEEIIRDTAAFALRLGSNPKIH